MIKNSKFLIAAFILFFAVNLTNFNSCFASGMVFEANHVPIVGGCGHVPLSVPAVREIPAGSTSYPVMPCCVSNNDGAKAVTDGNQVPYSPKFYANSGEEVASIDQSAKNNPSSEVVQVIIPPPQERDLTSVFKKE